MVPGLRPPNATRNPCARKCARPGERDQQRVRASRRVHVTRVRQRAPRGTRTRRRATTTTRRAPPPAKKSGGGGGKRRRSPVRASSRVTFGTDVGMGNERFMVPEVLFHPRISAEPGGIAEAAAQAVRSVHRIFGACSSPTSCSPAGAPLPGFKERFEAELRPFVPAEDELVDPRGGSRGDGGRRVRRGRGGGFRAARRHARGAREGPGGATEVMRNTSR